MFSGCSEISSKTINLIFNQFKNDNITSYQGCFGNCLKLKEVELPDTSKSTTFYTTFLNCYELETDITLQTDSCTSFSQTFNNCKKIKKINFTDTSKVKDFQSCFAGCRELIQINENNIIDTSSCTNASGMFNGCNNLKEIEFTDTSKITNTWGMFIGCVSLKSIKNLDLIATTNINSIFINCKALEELTISNILISGIDFSSCENLSHDSLINIRNACADYSTGDTHTITIGATNIAKLTDDELAEWQNKNWTVA